MYTGNCDMTKLLTVRWPSSIQIRLKGLWILGKAASMFQTNKTEFSQCLYPTVGLSILNCETANWICWRLLVKYHFPKQRLQDWRINRLKPSNSTMYDFEKGFCFCKRAICVLGRRLINKGHRDRSRDQFVFLSYICNQFRYPNTISYVYHSNLCSRNRIGMFAFCDQERKPFFFSEKLRIRGTLNWVLKCFQGLIKACFRLQVYFR